MIVGIDYSMSSPAVCLYDNIKPFSFENVEIHFIAQAKSHELYSDGILKGHSISLHKTQEERYDILATWAMQFIQSKHDQVFIEGYSFSSTGRVFNIAENTAILKHKLYRLGSMINTVPPTVIKKMATGKGNANKDMMYESFCKETNLKVELKDRLSPNKKSIGSPISDIVDAYYICKYGFNTLLNDDLKEGL